MVPSPTIQRLNIFVFLQIELNHRPGACDLNYNLYRNTCSIPAACILLYSYQLFYKKMCHFHPSVLCSLILHLNTTDFLLIICAVNQTSQPWNISIISQSESSYMYHICISWESVYTVKPDLTTVDRWQGVCELYFRYKDRGIGINQSSSIQ